MGKKLHNEELYICTVVARCLASCTPLFPGRTEFGTVRWRFGAAWCCSSHLKNMTVVDEPLWLFLDPCYEYLCYSFLGMLHPPLLLLLLKFDLGTMHERDYVFWNVCWCACITFPSIPLAACWQLTRHLATTVVSARYQIKNGVISGVYSTHGRSDRFIQNYGPKSWRAFRRPTGIIGKIILQWNIKKYNVRVWTGFIWLRIGSCGGLLWTW
jgi:hypothetical protein